MCIRDRHNFLFCLKAHPWRLSTAFRWNPLFNESAVSLHMGRSLSLYLLLKSHLSLSIVESAKSINSDGICICPSRCSSFEELSMIACSLSDVAWHRFASFWFKEATWQSCAATDDNTSKHRSFAIETQLLSLPEFSLNIRRNKIQFENTSQLKYISRCYKLRLGTDSTFIW